MTISLTIDTTEAEDVAVAHVLATTNADRIAAGEKPFADVPAFAGHLIRTVIADYGRQYHATIKESFSTAIDQASPDQIDQAAKVLGVRLPG